jgi:hypothetical protein
MPVADLVCGTEDIEDLSSEVKPPNLIRMGGLMRSKFLARGRNRDGSEIITRPAAFQYPLPLVRTARRMNEESKTMT